MLSVMSLVPKTVFWLGQLALAEDDRVQAGPLARRTASSARKAAALELALASNDARAVQGAILELGARRSPRQLDQAACAVLEILARPEMRSSQFAGHVLNFFVFEAPFLPPASKEACARFLAAHGHEFTDPHSAQVVWELRTGAGVNGRVDR
jgi:hypothetical protein